MQKAEIDVGQDYGFREKPADRGHELLRVTIEDRAARGQWIALWHDGPEKGKRTTIPSGNLVVPWKGAAALVQEERQLLALIESSDASWTPGDDEPLLDAVSRVLGFTGEFESEALSGGGWLRGHLRARRRPFERFCSRIGVAEDIKRLDPLGFVDRAGWVHLGFEAALTLAKRFAAMEPDVVLSCLAAGSKGRFKDPEPIDWTARENAADAIARGWTEGRATTDGESRDQVRLGDLDEEWTRPLRELQLLALRHGADRKRLLAMLGRCAEALRKGGDRSLPLELDLLLGNPILPDLQL